MIDRYLNQPYTNQASLEQATRAWPTQEHSPSFRTTEELSPVSAERRKFRTFEELEETPAFSTEFAQLCFEQHDSSDKYLPVNLGSASHSEVTSHCGLQEPAHIMQNINRNFKRNFKQLQLRRLRNRLEEVKGIQGDLQAFLREQAEFTSSCLQRISAEVGRWARKTAEQYAGQLAQQTTQQITEKERAILSLEGKIKEREQENGRLRKELQKEQEKSRLAQKTLTKKAVSYESRSSLAESCANCKILQIKHSALKEEILRAEQQMDSLVADNESLQEQIFDMEQRIVGIDLEVEKRLNEHVKSLGSLAIANLSPCPAQESEDYLQIVRRLNDENGHLQEKYEQLEKKCLREHDLKEWEGRLAKQEEEYQRKEASLFESLTALEKQQEKLYEREHGIYVAEENIANKMSELRHKEEELASWENLIHKSRGEQAGNALLPSVERRMGGIEDILPEEYNLNSFGKIQERYEIANPKHLPAANKYERTHSEQTVFIPMLPLRNNEVRQRVKTEFISEEEAQSQTPRTNWRGYGGQAQMAKRQDEKGRFGYRNERDISPGHDKYQRSGVKHQTNTPVSPQNYREASKNSRVSTNKSVRGPPIPPAVQERRERTQAVGLSSKLDKLRLQIKRQMDAIR